MQISRQSCYPSVGFPCNLTYMVLLTLKIGSNDVQLTNILNQCIFQWAVLNGEQVAVAKAAALKAGRVLTGRRTLIGTRLAVDARHNSSTRRTSTH